MKRKRNYLYSHWGNYIGKREGELFEYSSFNGNIHTPRTITDPVLIASFPMFDKDHRHLLSTDLEKAILDRVGRRKFFICTRHDLSERRYEVYSLDIVKS